jgi:Flp pilus assembly pilin Flp
VSARGHAARQQRGQAMLEYALIAGTVVMSFAVASQLGVTRSIADRMSQSQDAWSIRLPDAFTAKAIHDSAQKFNDQIKLK